MKSIETQEIKDAKAKRRNTAIGIVLVVILVLSTAGYGFYSASQGQTNNQNVADYNGIKFYDNGMYWETTINGVSFMFQYLPNETSFVKTSMNKLVRDYASRPLYFDSDNAQTESQIAQVLQMYASRIQNACVQNCSNTDLPIKNCSIDNVIVIEDAVKSEISQDKNCVFIKSPGNESIAAAEEFLYWILEIKKNINVPKFV